MLYVILFLWLPFTTTVGHFEYNVPDGARGEVRASREEDKAIGRVGEGWHRGFP